MTPLAGLPPATLCWLAAAITLSDGRGRTRRRGGRHPDRGTPRPSWVAVPWVLPAIGSAAALLACLAVLGPVAGVAAGLAAAALTHPAVRAVQRRQVRAPTTDERRSVPLALDVLAAVLRGGQPLAPALAAVAPIAAGRPVAALSRVAGLLTLGATPDAAWDELRADPLLGPVACTARRSAESGLRLAAGFEQLAAQVRAENRAAAHQRAHRAGVWAMAPLGLCFLPAFVCTGVVPVVLGIARHAFAGLGR